MAQVLVQNRVALAQPILPDWSTARRDGKEEVTQRADDRQSVLARRQLRQSVLEQLRDDSTSRRVGPAAGRRRYYLLGQRDYSMRLWLDPEKMSSRNLTSSDVVSAIQQQNAQVAAGQIGQPPVPNGQVFQYTMTTLGRLANADQFADMILKTDATGRIVRMRDVANIELGAQGYDPDLHARTAGLPCPVDLPVARLERPETQANLVRAKMEELKGVFPRVWNTAIV